MKIAVIVLCLLIASSASASELVGIAELKYVGTPDHQPGSCASLPKVKNQLECIDFTYWRRYKLVKLSDTKSQRLGSPLAVLASHTQRGGKWLVVLKRLNAEEAKAFGAEYRVIDGSPLFDVACLEKQINEYLPGRDVDAVGSPSDEIEDSEFCYDIRDIFAE